MKNTKLDPDFSDADSDFIPVQMDAEILSVSQTPNKDESEIKNSYNQIAISVIAAALIISGSIFYNTNLLVKSQGTQSQQQLAKLGGKEGSQEDPLALQDRGDQAVMGRSDAKVTMVEFGDFQCPYCQSFFQNTFPKIKSDYIDTGKIKYVFRQFPLTQIHVNAQIAAEASECANQQGKFWQFHDLLYTKGKADGLGLSETDLKKYADGLGLNAGILGFTKNKFNQCLESHSSRDKVQQDVDEGVKASVSGTPSFIINGKKIVGSQPLSVFTQAIDEALKQ